MKRPLISVCLPTYNGEKYLRQAVESILNQTVQDLELVIGDDRSTDSTRQILEEFARKDNRVKLTVNEVNLGYVPNCASIMRRCQGQFIKNFAQDDALAPDCCEKMLAIMQQHPNVTLVTAARTHIDEDNNVTGIHQHFDKTQMIAGKDVIKLYLSEFVNRTGNPTQIFFRGEHIMDGFNPAYHHGEDVEFGLRLLEKGDFYYISEPLILYRVHRETTTISTLVDMSFAPDYVRALDQFGHYAHQDGVDNDALWQAAIKGLIIKMSNALFTRGIKYDDFPTPKYFGHPQAADKNVQDEPEIFRRLACQLLKYISEKSREWKEVEDHISARLNQFPGKNQERNAKLNYITNLEKKVEAQAAEIIQVNEQLQTQTKELQSLKQSSSWKLTAPLRDIRSKIKR